MTSTGLIVSRLPFIVMREYVGVITMIAGITQTWPRIPAIILGCALVLGLATRVVAALAFVLLIAYTISLHFMPIGPGPTSAFAFLSLTVALTSTGRLWD